LKGKIRAIQNQKKLALYKSLKSGLTEIFDCEELVGLARPLNKPLFWCFYYGKITLPKRSSFHTKKAKIRAHLRA
jgi:hypothetical protein